MLKKNSEFHIAGRWTESIKGSSIDDPRPRHESERETQAKEFSGQNEASARRHMQAQECFGRNEA